MKAFNFRPVVTFQPAPTIQRASQSPQRTPSHSRPRRLSKCPAPMLDLDVDLVLAGNLDGDLDRIADAIAASEAPHYRGRLRSAALPVLVRITDQLMAEGRYDDLDRVAALISDLSAFGRPRERRWSFSFKDDVVVTEADSADAGLGGQTWTCGVVLARLIDEGRVRLQEGCRALELGSGTGLASIVAAATSAAAGRSLDLTLSDGDAGVLGNLRANLKRNYHLWGSVPSVQITTTHLDWKEPPVALERFDVVLAADFCYDRDAAQHVLRCAASLLRPAGQFYALIPFRDKFHNEMAEFERLAPSWFQVVQAHSITLPQETSPACRFYCLQKL